MRDLIAFSWNLEKMGLPKARLVVPTVAATLGKALKDRTKRGGMPILGFFQEVRGSAKDVIKICELMEREFKASLGDLNFEPIMTPAGKHNSEWIIVFTNVENIEYEKLDIKMPISKTIENNIKQAETDAILHVKEAKYEFRTSPAPSEKGEGLGDMLKPTFDKFLDDLYGADWYRDGVVCVIRDPITKREMRVGSLHAPGPNVTSRSDKVVAAIQQASLAANLDFLIGDLNYRGTIPGDVSNFGRGTTFKKRSFTELSNHAWDRVIANSSSDYKADVSEPIVAEPTAQGKRISDHALISAKFSLRPAEEYLGHSVPFHDRMDPVAKPESTNRTAFFQNKPRKAQKQDLIEYPGKHGKKMFDPPGDMDEEKGTPPSPGILDDFKINEDVFKKTIEQTPDYLKYFNNKINEAESFSIETE